MATFYNVDMRSIGGASCIHCPNKYSESWNKIQPVTWMVQQEYSTYTRTVYHGIHSIRDVGLVYMRIIHIGFGTVWVVGLVLRPGKWADRQTGVRLIHNM